MADEISYFQVAAFLAEIESVDISDSTERTQWLVTRLREKWPTLKPSQALAYVKAFEAG
jgi:hypothetical protein